MTIGITASICAAVFAAAGLYCSQHPDEAPITPRAYDDIMDMWHDLPHKKACPAVALAWQMVWASQEGKEYLTKLVIGTQQRKAITNDPALQKRGDTQDSTESSSYDWRELTSEKSQRRRLKR